MDVLALVAYFQCLAVVALALADVAGHVDVRQEVHLYLGHAVSLAGLAAATFYVEAETPGLVTPGAGLLGAGKQLPHGGENTGIGRRVGAGCAPNRALVDVDAFVDLAACR